MKELIAAFDRLAVNTAAADAALREFAQLFHPELVASGIPPELLSDPVFQRAVREAAHRDPSISLGGHLIQVAADMADCVLPLNDYDNDPDFS